MAPSVPAKYQSVVLRVFAESLAYLLDQLVNRDVHEPTVLRSAIIPDPFDFAVDADQYESVAGFPAGHGPLGGAVAFGDLASLVGKMMAINAVLLNSLGKLGRRIGGYAEEHNVKFVELRGTFQVHDLLHSRRSAIRHVEVEKNRGFAEIFIQMDNAAVGGEVGCGFASCDRARGRATASCEGSQGNEDEGRGGFSAHHCLLECGLPITHPYNRPTPCPLSSP